MEVRDLVAIDELLQKNDSINDIKALSERSRAIADKRNEILAELLELDTEHEGRNLTGGQAERWRNLSRAVERLKLAHERLNKHTQTVALRHTGPGNTLDPHAGYPSFNVNKAIGAFDPTNDDGLRARAMQAVETAERASDDAKESATKLLERSVRDPHLVGVEAHIYSTTHPAYVRAFEKYLNDPEGFRSDLSAEENEAFRTVNRRTRSDRTTPASFGDTEARAAMSLTAGNGGVLVPQFLDPTIHLTTTGAYSQVREIANVVSITVDQWDGVTSAGVTAEWLAEGAAAADATPTFVGPTITTHKAAAWLYGSYEVLMDSGFDQVAYLMADAKARLESVAHVSGNGSGQPFGLVNVLSGTGPVVTGTSGASGSADFVIADLYALDDALGPRFRPNASFLMAKPSTNLIRKRASELESQTVWADLGNGTPPSCIGYGVYRNENMPYTVTSGTNDHIMILGDFSYYTVVDRIGTTIQFVPAIMSTGTGTPTGQAGWFSYFRTGAAVLSSTAFKTLRL